MSNADLLSSYADRPSTRLAEFHSTDFKTKVEVFENESVTFSSGARSNPTWHIAFNGTIIVTVNVESSLDERAITVARDRAMRIALMLGE